MTDINYGERMLADRKARAMSRAAYAELTGLTQAKIANIEKGRAPKADELAKLTHLAFAGDDAPVAAAAAPAIDEQPIPGFENTIEQHGSVLTWDCSGCGFRFERTAVEALQAFIPEHQATCPGRILTAEQVLTTYTEVYNLLGGQLAPVAWQVDWDMTNPEHFSSIMQWCAQVVEALRPATLEVDPASPIPGTIETRPDEAQPGEIIGEALPPTGEETPLEVISDAERDLAGRAAADGLTDAEVQAELAALQAEVHGAEPEPAAPVIIDEPPANAELEAIAAEGEALADVTETWEIPDDGLRRLTNGELRTFKRCRRKWWLAYYRRLGLPSSKVTGASQLGTRIHRCLAAYYIPGFADPQLAFLTLERTIAEDMAAVGGDEFAVADLLKEQDLAHAMLEGYFEWLAETAADQGIDVVAPETKLEVNPNFPGHDDVRLLGKIDVRATRTFGADVARLVVDHKTVGDLTNPAKMLAFDEQMLHYHLLEYLDLLNNGVPGEEAEVIRTDGALYNMLRKVKRTATANPPFYGRVEVRHNIETLRSYWSRVLGELEEIQALEAKLAANADPRQVAYPTPTKDCSWDCDFYHVCTMFDDGSRAEDMLVSTYVTINPLARYEISAEGRTL